ncbi:hypothetical protein WH47_06041 [Habropoda laboriosa]|uniref:Uncharacterized protein n=1 Tax=Habropoda laboriosa TaxID=597456 RepID=A0A0L7QS55_9HYME|nr:hypothetical protein WH47_06041 [Habropoda laboriosa]
MKWYLVVLILAGVTRADNSVDTDYSIFKCPALNAQDEIDLNEVSPLSSLDSLFPPFCFFFFFFLCPLFSRDYVTAEIPGFARLD